ncbi:PE-PPE domain-containing protein [Mycolicibacterium palauense]|uniref:PE-PPE domain-containing protein n=1 Tax=Mycolicibacterium palauense TaxID=2034511 RepID=UPI000BFEFADE|nr:PE-PPE domain-containing protein [Mycolicibacterium palauense]
MKRLLAGALALGVVGYSGGFGPGTAFAETTSWAPPGPGAADQPFAAEAGPGTGPAAGPGTPPVQVVYAVGGARPPGIPWYDYAHRLGAGYYPGADREIIDYPAGAPFSWVPDMFATHRPDENVSIGVAADDATATLNTAIEQGTRPAAAVGLSLGSLALDKEQARLSTDPNAPAPDMLQFTTIGDPVGHSGFGKSFLSGLFPPGSYIPIIDYTMPDTDNSQYDTKRVVAAYDGLSDFPDRPDNLISVANATVGSAIVHTPVAFTGPEIVPPQNIKTTTNARGATTTTYLVPVNHLPLTLPLRYLGMSDADVDQMDAVLQPIVDSGYSRNDNPATATVMVDPLHGMDPVGSLDPATRAEVENAIATVRGYLAPLG